MAHTLAIQPSQAKHPFARLSALLRRQPPPPAYSPGDPCPVHRDDPDKPDAELLAYPPNPALVCLCPVGTAGHTVLRYAA